MNRNLKTRANNGFTIIELIVVVAVIGLLVAIAVGAYNKGFKDAKVTKSLAFVNTLATAKALFVADPKTTPALISTFNDGPNGNFAMIFSSTTIEGLVFKTVLNLRSNSGEHCPMQL
jgi:prepilin-type N-terminal cleavage/methylation domain-containing protein